MNDDSLLISLLQENDEVARDLVYEKYSYLVDYIIKKYLRIIRYFKIPLDEIKAEAFLGFSDGMRSFTSKNDTSLKTFLYMCIERRILKYIRHTMTIKIQTFNDSLSLDYADDSSDDSNASIKNFLFEDKYNPLNNMLEKETISKIYSLAKDNLSNFEYKVFYFLSNNFTYNEIAKLLGKSLKQVDNAISRIKFKMKKALEKEEII